MGTARSAASDLSSSPSPRSNFSASRSPNEASAASLSSRLSTWAKSLAARQRISGLALSIFFKNWSGDREPLASQLKPSSTVTAPVTIRPGIRNSCTMCRPDGGRTGGKPFAGSGEPEGSANVSDIKFGLGSGRVSQESESGRFGRCLILHKPARFRNQVTELDIDPKALLGWFVGLGF